MGIFTKLAAVVFGPTDASGNARGADMGEVQTWGVEVEAVLNALSTGAALLYSSKSAMDADLAHAAATAAIVIGDATVANNGWYRKSGASGSGSWIRVGDVPGYSFIKASNAGAGTANAIIATTVTGVPSADGGALIALPIFVNNTGAATVAFDGGTALQIKTNSGQDVLSDYLIAGTTVFGIKDSGGTIFRLISDVATSADRTAAETAATDASASASLAASYAASQRYLVARFATTANVDLAGGGLAAGTTHDGINAVAGDIVFVRAQTDEAENGVYTVPSSGASSRKAPFDSYNAYPGAAVRISEGTAYGKKEFRCTSFAGGTLGTDDIVFSPSIVSRVLPDAGSSDMRDLKQSLGVDLSLADYGLTVNDSASATQTANVTKFATVVSDMRTHNLSRCFVPPGNWYFNSGLTVDWGLLFYGNHMSTSVIVATHTGTGILFTGANGTGGGLTDLSVNFDTGGGTSTAAIEGIAAVGGTSPDFLRLERLNMSGFNNSLMAYGIILDGNARDGSAPNGLIGIRDIVVSDIQSFNKNGGHNLDVRQGHGVVVETFQTFQGNSPTNTTCSFSGANTSKSTAGLYISKLVTNVASFDFCSQFTVQGYAFSSWTVTSNALSGKMNVAGAAVSNNSPGSVTVI